MQDGGKSYDVAQIAEEYRRGFQVMRSLPCDVPLGSHPAMYNMTGKYARIGKGANPFIDPQGYRTELDKEGALTLRYSEQKKAAGQ